MHEQALAEIKKQREAAETAAAAAEKAGVGRAAVAAAAAAAAVKAIGLDPSVLSSNAHMIAPMAHGGGSGEHDDSDVGGRERAQQDAARAVYEEHREELEKMFEDARGLVSAVLSVFFSFIFCCYLTRLVSSNPSFPCPYYTTIHDLTRHEIKMNKKTKKTKRSVTSSKPGRTATRSTPSSARTRRG